MSNATSRSDGMETRATVLIVEDDSDIVEIITLYLCGSGYRVLSAGNGAAGLDLMRTQDVSLVLVDLMMPVMNGFEFIKEVRAFSNVPVVVISARSQGSDKLLGLEVGADGYIVKPFDPMEVLGYVKAMLRRCYQMNGNGETGSSGEAAAEQGSQAGSILRAGDLELDKEALVLRKHGIVVPLTPTELRILVMMMAAPRRVFTKAQLGECATGSSFEVGDSVMVHISNIRAKIEDDPGSPTHIITVRGLGYRFES